MPRRLDDEGAEQLRQLGRVGILELREKSDDVLAVGQRQFVGDDGDGGAARIFAGGNDFDDGAALDRDEGDAIEEEADLDDADGFLARDFAGDIDDDRRGSGDLGVIHEALFREPLVEIEGAFEFGDLEAHGIAPHGDPGQRRDRGRRRGGRGHEGRWGWRDGGAGWQGRALRQGGGGKEGRKDRRDAQHNGVR